MGFCSEALEDLSCIFLYIVWLGESRASGSSNDVNLNDFPIDRWFVHSSFPPKSNSVWIDQVTLKMSSSGFGSFCSYLTFTLPIPLPVGMTKTWTWFEWYKY